MLSRDSWWPQAEHLKPGQKRRTDHDCGSGRTLMVECRVDRSYSAWCHSCNEGGWAPAPAEALAEKLARLSALRSSDEALPQAEQPMPRIYDVSLWPDGAAVWLYKAGLSRGDLGRLGIYWHRESDRVVLPVGTRFYQARAYQPGRLPKYLGPTPRPPNLLARWGSAEVPTLTEDILSAIKVGMVAEGWAVLGTRVSSHMVAMILKRGGRVNVWLDPDKAGREGAAKIIKQLHAYGVQTRNILSARDPKLHSREEIKEILNAQLQSR